MAGLPFVVCALALAGSVTATLSPPKAAIPRLRPLDTWSKALVARGLEKSPTFRALVDRLARADLIVYVAVGPRVATASGALRFVGTSATFRFVHVSLDQSLTNTELVAVLGHELQHAVEVAESPDVRDLESFRRYYQQQGEVGSEIGRFETEAARRAGRRVREDLAGREGPGAGR